MREKIVKHGARQGMKCGRLVDGAKITTEHSSPSGDSGREKFSATASQGVAEELRPGDGIFNIEESGGTKIFDLMAFRRDGGGVQIRSCWRLQARFSVGPHLEHIEQHILQRLADGRVYVLGGMRVAVKRRDL